MTGRHKAIVAADRAQRAAVGTRNRVQVSARTSEPATKARGAASNQAIAAVAREHAAHEPAGSLGRRAWGCLAVALSTTGSVASARRVLDMVQAADVRDTARKLLDQLTTERGT